MDFAMYSHINAKSVQMLPIAKLIGNGKIVKNLYLIFHLQNITSNEIFLKEISPM